MPNQSAPIPLFSLCDYRGEGNIVQFQGIKEKNLLWLVMRKLVYKSRQPWRKGIVSKKKIKYLNTKP